MAARGGVGLEDGHPVVVELATGRDVPDVGGIVGVGDGLGGLVLVLVRRERPGQGKRAENGAEDDGAPGARCERVNCRWRDWRFHGGYLHGSGVIPWPDSYAREGAPP